MPFRPLVVEREDAPLLSEQKEQQPTSYQTIEGETIKEVLLPSVTPPPPSDYTPNFLDRHLPSVHGRPLTYQLWQNVGAGLTVALINIPLSLSLAVASESTPNAGIITATWAGLFAAVFGGSQYNIMGPTGALSGILARYAIMWGPGCLPLLSLSSGLVMLLVFMLNWDKYVTFLPSSVAHGFTLGVAFIIAGGQIGSAFSLPAIHTSEHFLVNFWSYMQVMGQADWRAFAIFFGLWAALFVLVRKFPRIPWMIPVASVGVLLGYLSTKGYLFKLTCLRDKYGELSLVLFDFPDFAKQSNMLHDWTDLCIASLSVAFVGVLETLISGKIADGMTRTSMLQRQEVFAVSVANLAAGVAGGLPATAALARTALNIRSGATSRLAGIFNALFTLLIGMVLLPIFGYLPLCAVAALLFQVAINMIEFKHLSHALHIDRSAFWLTLLVGALCLILDPTAAIVVGAVFGLLRFAESVATGYSEVTLTQDYQSGTKLDLSTFDSHHTSRQKEGMVLEAWRKLFPLRSSGAPASPSRRQLEAHVARQRGRMTEVPDQHTVVYRIIGDLTYISAMHHTQRIKRLNSGKNLIISFRYCYYVDLDGLDALEECLREIRSRPDRAERHILLSSFPQQGMVASLLSKCGWFEREFKSKGLVFDSAGDAIDFIKEHANTPNTPSNQHHLSVPSELSSTRAYTPSSRQMGEKRRLSFVNSEV